MKISKIFYAWQSDLPNPTNRGFIEEALEKAVRSIRGDESIQIDPVVDRDTLGVPGAPNIADTILAKINQSAVFVCDVSIINSQSDKRLTPNPNVLFELGYALKTLGPDRLVLVMNTAYGEKENLPFDLRIKRVISYYLQADTEDKASKRMELAKDLEIALKTIYSNIALEEAEYIETADTNPDLAIQAIEADQINAIVLTRRFISSLISQLEENSPDFPGIDDEIESEEILLESLNKTEQLLDDFSQFVLPVALTRNSAALIEILRGFERIVDHYSPPSGFSGRFFSTHQDYYRFLGHEFFVVLIASLLNENCFDLIPDLLTRGIYVKNSPYGRPRVMPYTRISEYVELLERRNRRLKLNLASLRADILKERHSKGVIAEISPFREFVEADFFLYLREGLEWRAWSTIYIGSNAPRYLVEATRKDFAKLLLSPLNVENIEEMRELVRQRIPELHKLFPHAFPFYPLEDFDPRTIGTSI